MPEIPPPSTEPRYVCCCETDPPSLRCGSCSWPNFNHQGCHSPTRIN